MSLSIVFRNHTRERTCSVVLIFKLTERKVQIDRIQDSIIDAGSMEMFLVQSGNTMTSFRKPYQEGPT